MRINKYLAGKGYATRRGSDELVKRGMVSIDGRKAVLGDVVESASSVVEVRGRGKSHKYHYFAYNKPRGVITHSPQDEEEDIRGNIKDANIPKGVFPVGRLDKDSHGLIVLTDDGRITDRLLNPDYSHEKEYIVKTLSRLRSSFKDNMEKGVDIDGYKTKPCRVEIRGENEFGIRLTEGKKHQIRRMCVALYNEVSDLRRVRVMNIKLGNLSPGAVRPIGGEELRTFLKEIGL